MSFFAWTLVAAGIFGIAAAHFDWTHSRVWSALDLFGMHELLDQQSIAGGRNRYYRQVGWLFLTLGVFLLVRLWLV